MNLNWYLLAVVAILVIVVPFVLGNYWSRRLRMPDHGWRIGVSLFALIASAVIVLLGWPPRLGVDLSGGVILVYEVEQKAEQADQKVDMDKLIAALARRVNPGGQKEVTIRTFGPQQVEIIIPKVANEEEIRQIEDIIGRAGTLEFRILANNRDHAGLIERARQDERSEVLRDSTGKVVAWWVPIESGRENELAYPEILRRQRKVRGREVTEILVVADNYNVRGEYLRRASPSHDRQGRPSVSFMFNSVGAEKFGGLTGDNLPDKVSDFTRKLGIILDGKLYSAPSIQSTIYDQGEISGSFTPKEVDALVNVLNAGSLPASLNPEPISRLFTGPTLGSDTIRQATTAMIIASILVPLFMLWYYRFAGLVADIVLVLNMLMLIAIMITIKAAFTLPGFAALALTVGMAVDNNVLVFERLREELERGATLRMAIRNAFHRAGGTIIDCNMTHFLASTVLYVIGTEQVKGFAVTLWLGSAISIFTSVFVARVIFEIAEKRQWVTRLKMLHVIRHTNFDFMGLFKYTATFSVVTILLSIVVAGMRGQGLLDIDFTGGVSIQALFREPQDINHVRRELENLPDVAISNVGMQGEQEGLRFDINTSERDLKVVQQRLKETFGDKLQTNSVKISQVALVSAAASPGEKTAKPAEKPAAKPTEKPAAKPAEKPVEGPVLHKPEKAEKTGAKPAEKAAAKPAEKPAAPAAPPAEKAPKKEPAKDGKTPDKKQQSRADLPPDNWVASTDWLPLPLVLAADKPAEKSSKPADKPAAKSESAKPAEKAASKPAEKPAAKTEPEKAAAKPAAPAEMPAEKPLATPAEKPFAAATGPVPSADPFAGGTKATLEFRLPVAHQTVADEITAAMRRQKIDPEKTPFEVGNDQYQEGSAQSFPKWEVKIQLPPEKARPILDAVENVVKTTPFFPSSNAIGGAVAAGTRVQAIYAIIASWALMILYLWIRFQKVAFGVAAVLALVHDVFVMLGAIAVSYYVAPYLGFLLIEPFKINLPIVAAFLTIIGYSVNDTIVVFDRIREVRGKDPNLTVKMVNDSTNQTLSRTILTSVTVAIVVIVLYFFAGQALRGFSFALAVGVITGTFSSIYVAAPILLWLIGSPGPKHGQVETNGKRLTDSREGVGSK